MKEVLGGKLGEREKDYFEQMRNKRRYAMQISLVKVDKDHKVSDEIV